MSLSLEPREENVVVRRNLPRTHTAAGLEIPEQHADVPLDGVVEAVSRKVAAAEIAAGGNLHAGSVVLFGRFAGTPVPTEYGERLIMMRAGEVMAVVHEVPEPAIAKEPETTVPDEEPAA